MVKIWLNRLKRGYLLLALLGLLIFLLDITRLWPGVGSASAPLLLGIGLLLLERDNQRRGRRLRRRLQDVERQLGKTPAAASMDAPSRVPRQPEYRGIAWNGLTLRSQSEIKIAKVLDQRGILFWGGGKARLKTGNYSQTREVDFLIFHEERWGILEVDGPQHERAVQSDQQRDRYFTEHGILVQRFPADLCFKQPEQVIDTFLERLMTNGV